jgi:hypothetical protein
MGRIVELAGRYGTLAQPDSLALRAFPASAADPTVSRPVLAIVKLMGPGIYALDSGPGSGRPFGLATHDYTRDGANRRYADLVTQRFGQSGAQGTPGALH